MNDLTPVANLMGVRKCKSLPSPGNLLRLVTIPLAGTDVLGGVGASRGNLITVAMMAFNKSINFTIKIVGLYGEGLLSWGDKFGDPTIFPAFSFDSLLLFRPQAMVSK